MNTLALAALIVAALALGVGSVALWLAVLARGNNLALARGLAAHRSAHANAAEERRATRHRAPEEAREHVTGPPPPPPPAEPATEELAAQDAPTRQAPAVRLPRPGLGSPDRMGW